MTGKRSIQVAIVGFGKIARDQHRGAIATTCGVELVATADPAGFATGKARYPDLDTMLAQQPGIEAVILCQPPQFRFAAARTAIRAGKHVFLEKPPAETLAEVEQLAAEAGKAGVSLFTAWHSQKAAGVGAARAFLEDAAIRSVHVEWKEDVRVWHPGQRWIWEKGGFGVFDPGINALSILTDVVPCPLRVASAMLDVPSNCAMPIAAALDLATERGAPIQAMFDFLHEGPPCWDIRFETDRGVLLLGNGGNRLSINGQQQSLATESEYPRLYRQFVELVAAGASHVDTEPLRLVLECFRVGEKRTTTAFSEKRR